MSVSPRGPTTAPLAVHLLGGLQVWRDGQRLPQPFPTRKTASLFAFLLLHPDAEHSRRFLAGAFWPDAEDALHSLAAALVPIRRLLEPRPEEKGRCLVSHRHALCLIPPPGCWVDVWAFERAFDEGIRASPESPEWLRAREEAVALYGGDLLPDAEYGWCASRREELRQHFSVCLHDLSLRPQRKTPEPRLSRRTDSLNLSLTERLVGREREQDRLQAAWTRAQAGRGELILLTGEAGIGKSRLGHQILQGVALDGGLALYGQASALESGFLYRPLVDPLRRALELANQHGLTLGAPVWQAQVAHLLPEMPHGEESLSASEADGPGLLEQSIVQLFMSLAAQRPLCLFLDDLQWADAATGRVLHALCHQARQADLLSQPAHVLLLASVREEEVAEGHWLGPWLTELQGQRMAAALPLSRLDEEEVARLLTELAEGNASETLLRSLSERLHQETEGNPLFVLETVRDLFERGYLEVGPEGRWRLTADPAAPPEAASDPSDPSRQKPLARRLPLPATVQRVVRQRVDRLGVEERELLECAAVIGRRFTFETLRRVVGQDVEPTLTLLERLLATGLIRAQAHPAALDFSHDKIREVIYEDLAPPRRQELHLRVGEALEAIYGVADEEVREEPPRPDWYRHPLPLPPRAEHAEELARHFHEAAPRIGPEKAARYHCLAGMRARALMNYEKAVHDLLIALSLIAELPLDAARLALWGQIVQQLAPAYRGTGRAEAAREALEEYLALCERHGYAAGIAHSCVLLGRFLDLFRHPAERETMRAMYERAIAVGEAHGLRNWIAYPQAYLAHRLAVDGDDLEQAEALARGCLPPAGARQDRLVLQHAYLALMWIAARRGDWEVLREVFQASLAAGGPLPLRLPSLLDLIEQNCHRTGTDTTFVALCRDMAEGYARAGLISPLEQWYLVPASARPAPGEPAIREEFDAPGWDPALIWLDATGLTHIDRATRPGWLGLGPPVGPDLWPEADLNAPRLVAPVKGDFMAQTRVEPDWEVRTLAGLLVWRDEQHFARLELRALPGEGISVHLEACVAGRFRRIGRGRCERQPMWLRVERTGEEVRGLCSADGEQWLTCGAVRLPQEETEQVGLAAITPDVGAHVWFDTFLLWREPAGDRR
jgi:predicted ATPase/regulation of enolase protein 1 (concanavalin A-like superfamily)